MQAPAFIHLDNDVQLRDRPDMLERGMSIGQIQIQLAQKIAVAGRNGIPTALLNHSAMKHSYDAKRSSNTLLNQSLVKSPQYAQISSAKFYKTRTPALKSPSITPQSALQYQIGTPNNKYRTNKGKG